MDNIFVFGASKSEHDKRLEQTLETVTEAGLILNKSKCSFGVTEISFFGSLVSKDRIESDLQKVIVVRFRSVS